jgi:hypothetical protein
MHSVRRLLDHDSPEMTARYATIKDQTLRCGQRARAPTRSTPPTAYRQSCS